ncbi:cyclin-like protein [Hypoxylon fuscum]|nr:cyclin-like protein [Hypoxylon fuscum]
MGPTNHTVRNGNVEMRIPHVGPHLGIVKVGTQYVFESHIRQMMANRRLNLAQEANYRLQGVQVIDSVRSALLLPVKTYNAACTIYHQFRLEHPTHDYSYTDAALASLFVACKGEDTLKKSKEILCAHHNLKNPDHLTTPDDKIFEAPSKVIIGLERLMVEAINFDFRSRNPQKILIKILKRVLGDSADAKYFFVVAFKMSFDMYKTYAPLKHNTYTCAIAVAQLTALVTKTFVDELCGLDLADWHTDAQCVAEVTLDLLDLYTQHGKATKVGPMFDLQDFIQTQIGINRTVEHEGLLRYVNQCRDCESAMVSPATPFAVDSPASLNTPTATATGSGSGSGPGSAKRGPQPASTGTTRFVFDADEAARERQAYDEHTKDEWDEWEEEVEEPVPDARDDVRRSDGPRGPRGPRGHGRGHGRGGFEPGWNPRNRHDRRRGRGGNFY